MNSFSLFDTFNRFNSTTTTTTVLYNLMTHRSHEKIPAKMTVKNSIERKELFFHETDF